MSQTETERVVLDPIERAIDDIRAGRAVVVVDDENRENEGDLVFAAPSARFKTPFVDLGLVLDAAVERARVPAGSAGHHSHQIGVRYACHQLRPP